MITSLRLFYRENCPGLIKCVFVCLPIYTNYCINNDGDHGDCVNHGNEQCILPWIDVLLEATDLPPQNVYGTKIHKYLCKNIVVILTKLHLLCIFLLFITFSTLGYLTWSTACGWGIW